MLDELDAAVAAFAAREAILQEPMRLYLADLERQQRWVRPHPDTIPGRFAAALKYSSPAAVALLRLLAEARKMRAGCSADATHVMDATAEVEKSLGRE